MNTQIRELEKQAISIVLNGDDPDKDVDQMYIPSEFTKKFAELIVRECADQFRLVHTDEQYARRIDKTILKHFGLYE